MAVFSLRPDQNASLIWIKAGPLKAAYGASMQNEHLDRALAEEFAGHGEIIHQLKVADPHFKSLMELNHKLWEEIRGIQSGAHPASDAHLESLEKQRLKILDEIATLIAQAKA